MIAIECPFCSGQADVEPTLEAVNCAVCGVSVDVAPDPIVELDAAA